ncbi:unnamed protein product [Medioppia subpectinata]|uniref:Uncharacterized protein n=1 Tax=Medioppia subpectinata TaxID=1979941 RepID=A0A7R9LFJ5_9ACAR|nr:unnamed protein product [Medioppia subpectinata]CAG2117838.1 unnamed protein product [Medioppia subpectinata]
MSSQHKSGGRGEEVVVIAKYDYTAQGSQELDLKKGDRLSLLDDSKHWWKVLNGRNQSGFVPSNYVKREKPSIFDSIRKRVRKKTDSHRHNSPLASPIATKAVDINITSSPGNSLPRPDMSANRGINSNEGSASTTSYLKITAYVKYNYESQQSDELSLVKGSKVTVMEKSSDGWWRGELNGAVGWFPSNYVYEESTDSVNNGLDQQNQMLSKNSKLVNEMNIESNRNKVPVMASNGSTSSNANCILDFVVALYSFQSQNEEELSFQKSERLEIIERPANDPDWWKARNQHGELGLVPKNYVQVVNDNFDDGLDSFNLMSVQKEMPKVSAGLSSPQIQSKTRVPLVAKMDVNEKMWYFGTISRGQCDHMLNELAEDGDFLIRDSETNPVASKPSNLLEYLDYKKAPIYTSPKGDKMFLIKPFARPQH